MIAFQTMIHLISQGGSTGLIGMAGVHGGIGMGTPTILRDLQGQSGRYGLSVPILD